MKKVFKALCICFCTVVLLGGCAKSKEAVFNYKSEGIDIKETVTYKGNKVENEFIVNTLTYDKLTAEELEQFKVEMIKPYDEYKGIKGMTVKTDVTDTKTIITIDIDFKNNLESLIDAGIVEGEDEGVRPDYLAFDNVKSQLKEEGFVQE
ncbi:MAG: DUF1307 domain-containing protein [Erysipelotrichaceae bacterium]